MESDLTKTCKLDDAARFIRPNALRLKIRAKGRMPDTAPSPSPRPNGERVGVRGFELDTIGPSQPGGNFFSTEASPAAKM